jgi:hypothetical protein
VIRREDDQRVVKQFTPRERVEDGAGVPVRIRGGCMVVGVLLAAKWLIAERIRTGTETTAGRRQIR